MTALPDPGHAGGNQIYRPPLPPCACGDIAGVHNITTNGRGKCTAWHGDYCTCRHYIPELAPPGLDAESRPGPGGASNPTDPP